MSDDDACADPREEAHAHFAERAVDNSSWDGGAAMSRCSSSATPSSCFSSICAGKRSGDPSKEATWALPHHATAGGLPNAAGVRNALARLDQTQGLTNKAAAEAHLNAHMKAISPTQKAASARPPRDHLYRIAYPGIELIRSVTDGGMPTLSGHFAVFREWTEIDSIFEGNFMEQFAPGAFKRTIQINAERMRVLFQHGRDPQIGNKPLGPIATLREDKQGAYYEAPMLDTSYNRDLIPGLEKGLYGASMRFRVIKEELNEEPGRSAYNENGIPERVVTEAEVLEFGPVTFPQYAGATAGVRSITDDIIMGQYLNNPERLRDLLAANLPEGAIHALLERVEVPHSPSGAAPEDGNGESREPVRQLAVYRNPNKKK